MEDLLGVGKAVEKIVDPVMALLTRIAGPAADEIGLTLQDRVHVFRARQAHRLGEKFLAFCQQRKVETRKVDLKLLLPIFDNASVEEDEDLHTMWANLLTNAADSKGGLILPSFAHTLKQLTAEEVRYLDRLWRVVLKPPDYVSVHRFGRELLSYSNLVQLFNPDINTGVNPAEWHILRGQFTGEQKANYEQLGRVELVIEDLIRLDIIGEHQVAEPDRYLSLGNEKIPFERSQTILRSQYSFSQYGVSFMQAVTAKDESFNE